MTPATRGTWRVRGALGGSLARQAAEGAGRTRAHAPQATLVALAIAVLLALASAPAIALAAEGDDENLVDPTQRADNSFIYDTTIGSLFNQSSLYDDRTVQVVGEVIGDQIDATEHPGYCWITVTSADEEDKSSISVLMSDDQASQIDRFGRYGVTGTILQVRGTYHQACDEHDGLPDIHATNTGVMQRGTDHADQFVPDEFLPGILAVLIGLGLMGGFYFARERMR